MAQNSVVDDCDQLMGDEQTRRASSNAGSAAATKPPRNRKSGAAYRQEAKQKAF